MPNDAGPLARIVDDLEDSGSGDQVTVGDVLAAFQQRSLGMLLSLFALLALVPLIGSIPGASILTGSLIVLVVIQSMVGGGALWTPGFVRRRGLSRDRLRTGLERARPWADRVDRLLCPCWTFLVDGLVNRVMIAVAVVLLAVTFYPLAFVPWGVMAPASGVLAYGLGLTGRDGRFVLAGHVLVGGTVALMVLVV